MPWLPVCVFSLISSVFILDFLAFLEIHQPQGSGTPVGQVKAKTLLVLPTLRYLSRAVTSNYPMPMVPIFTVPTTFGESKEL